MTNQELHRIIMLGDRVEEYKAKVFELEMSVSNCKSPSYDGMPKATGTEHPIEKYVEARERLEKEIKRLETQRKSLIEQMKIDYADLTTEKQYIMHLRIVERVRQSEIARLLDVDPKKVWRVLNSIGFRE